MNATYATFENSAESLPTSALRDAASKLFTETDHTRLEEMVLFECMETGRLFATTNEQTNFVSVFVGDDGITAETVALEDVNRDALTRVSGALGGD